LPPAFSDPEPQPQKGAIIMFTKNKKVGEGYHVRKFDAHKKVIDWDAVCGLAFVIFMGLLLIGWITN
jgi:hypothetical protein